MEEAIIAIKLGLMYFSSNPQIFILMTFGVIFGLIFGCIPGLTATLAVSLLLPFTYKMAAQQGIAMLIGVYVGGISGGLYGAILLNIPGTPAALVTCFDGYPMAKKGQVTEALSLGIFCSTMGGIISMFFLAILSPLLAKIALMFGPYEFAALGFMGLGIVVSLTSKSLIKGLIGAVIGVFLSMVGTDPVVSGPRFTFGLWQLSGGLPLLSTLMGFFAVSEILSQTANLGVESSIIKVTKKVPIFPPLELLKKSVKGIGISSLIGTWVGILPGVGQSTGSLLAYNQLQKMSKSPEKFGTGYFEGVVASETANNAVCGGALIPMLTLGVPGDLVTAVLLGALIIQGLEPGPLLFQKNIDIVGSVFISYFLANIIMFIVAISCIKIFVRLLRVPTYILYPVILVMCVLGTFTIRSRVFDSWVLLLTGVLGYFLRISDFGLPPVILGFILGPIIEINFRIAMQVSNNDFSPFFTRPIALVLVIISIYQIAMPLISNIKHKKDKK